MELQAGHSLRYIFLFIGDFDDYNDRDTYFNDDIQFLERGGATTFKGKIRARPTIAV